jgi:hypothetical protein
MPLFYFDCHHADCPEECVGHELVDHTAAHKMGIEFAGEILQHEAQALVDGHDLNVTVSDANHLALYSFYATSVAAPSVRGGR